MRSTPTSDSSLKAPWRQKSACASMWDDEEMSGAWIDPMHPSVAEAKKICESCLVRRGCVIDAINDPAAEGIRGGATFSRGNVSSSEMRRLRKELDLPNVGRGSMSTYSNAPVEAL